jgi:hypothetical protein
LKLLTPLAYFWTRLRKACCRGSGGLMVFGLSLLIAAGILLWPAGLRSRAAEPLPHAGKRGNLVRTATPQAVLPAVETVPSPPPTATSLPTPTPLPIPDQGLVWVENASGVYLWGSPLGNILTHLPNGSMVQLLEERAAYGNLPWIKVCSPSGEGWLLQTQVFRARESPAAYIVSQQGTYLRDRPRGAVQQLLSLGTPIMNILAAQEGAGRTWAQVEVVDGTVGWVPEEWLAAELPMGANQD